MPFLSKATGATLLGQELKTHWAPVFSGWGRSGGAVLQEQKQ